MNVSVVRHASIRPLPLFLGLVGVSGALAALVGVYVDDSWHTDVGRDTFWSPPHLLLYAGVLVASLCVLAWADQGWRSAGGGIRGARSVLLSPAVWLAGVGGVATAVSAPLDDAWHQLFGRDAVLWSPPHLVGVAGTVGLAVGLLAGLGRTSGRMSGPARVLAATAVVGGLQVLVLEYDSDVPQFDTLWYFPVAALAVCLALAFLEDLLPGRRALVLVALAYTAVRVGIVLILAAAGLSLTAVPPVAAALLLAAALSRVPSLPRWTAVGAAVPALWWVGLSPQLALATSVPAAELLLATLLSAAAGALVAVLHGDVRISTRAAAAVVPAVIVVLASTGSAPPAAAHDPGQGRGIASAEIELRRTGERSTIDVAVAEDCPQGATGRTVARRAGVEISGPLDVSRSGGACTMSGSVVGLTPGRWFVYAELTASEGPVYETWLATPEGAATATDNRTLYEVQEKTSPPWRGAVEGLLVLVVCGMGVTTLRLSRRVAAERAT